MYKPKPYTLAKWQFLNDILQEIISKETEATSLSDEAMVKEFKKRKIKTTSHQLYNVRTWFKIPNVMKRRATLFLEENAKNKKAKK